MGVNIFKGVILGYGFNQNSLKTPLFPSVFWGSKWGVLGVGALGGVRNNGGIKKGIE